MKLQPSTKIKKARRTVLLAIATTSLSLTYSCGEGPNKNNALYCSVSDEDRCYDAGKVDGQNRESPNASAADCINDCQQVYCNGYCDHEVYFINEECDECMD
jgi:hypothetical protein